jgi:hypothetical protein
MPTIDMLAPLPNEFDTRSDIPPVDTDPTHFIGKSQLNIHDQVNRQGAADLQADSVPIPRL